MSGQGGDVAALPLSGGAKTTLADCLTAFTSTSSTLGRRPGTAVTVFC
ncbi:hypothetical protein [Streptomyces vinaceus]